MLTVYLITELAINRYGATQNLVNSAFLSEQKAKARLLEIAEAHCEDIDLIVRTSPTRVEIINKNTNAIEVYNLSKPIILEVE